MASKTHEQVHWRQVDLLDHASVAKLIAELKPNYLLHLAWITEHGIYWQSPENIRWLDASKALLEAFSQHGGHRVVVAGTCAEYDWQAGNCHETTTPLKGNSRYSQSKIELAKYLASLSDNHDLQTAWGRVFFAFGPGEPTTRLIPTMISRLSAGKFAECSDGLHRRDFLYVDDVAAAFVQLLLSRVTGPVNLGSGKATSIRDLVTLLGKLMRREDLLRIGSRPLDRIEPPLVVADVTRLRHEVEFVPRFSLEAGLQATIHSLTSNEGVAAYE
jgi:nucleoside-diphosphate-sugar epimerase